MSYAANPSKKQKASVDTEAAAALRQQKQDRERIRRLIITLGDEKKKVLGQIRGLAGALEDDVELHGELMADTFLDCVKHLPLKSTIYSALAARMAGKHAAWVRGLVQRALVDLRAAVRAGSVVEAQLLLRFFACLGNSGLLGLSQVLRLLKEVVALSEGLKPAKGGDLGVFLALSTLIFLSPASYAKAPKEVAAVLESAGTYLTSREARWKTLHRLLKSGEEPTDRLEALAVALQALVSASWKCEAVLHVPGLEPKEEGHPEMPQEDFSLEVSAEEVRKSKVRMQVPLMSCRIVTGSGGTMPEQDRWVLEDYVLSTLEMFGRDVEECSKQIMRIPVLHDDFDTIVVETIFSQMLRLPSPPLLPVFYSRLLETLVTMQGTMAQVVDKVFVAYFRELPNLDEECLDVLAETFAYHLVHAEYKTDWSVFTGDDATVHAQRFVRRALERLQRLSFHQNLLHRLPESMHVYVPPEPLPATDLPVQAMPEFKSVLGIAKIKDPDDQKVLRFCRKLMNTQTSEDLQEEEAERAAAAAAPASEKRDAPKAAKVKEVKEVTEVKEEKEEESKLMTEAQAAETVRKEKRAAEAVAEEPGAPPAKRAKADGEDSAGGGAPGGEKVEADGEPPAPAAAAEAASAEGGEAAARAVKEEPKQEDEADGAAAAGVAAAEEPAAEQPLEPWPLEAVVELLVVATLHNGAKTPTHMSKMLDGYQKVFSKLRPDDEERAHAFSKIIVRSAFEFWRVSGQRLEITLDTLLHRGIVTPRAVVEQALADRGPLGCDSLSIWNLINGVALKALERSQSAKAELAIAKKLEKADAMARCKEHLDVAIQDTAELFTLIFAGLARNHQDFEEKDALLRHVAQQRVLTIARKYYAFIKPLIENASSRIPGVAHNPDIATIFQSMSTL